MVEYVQVVGSLLMNGPTGIMVSLGIENVPGISLQEAYMYYNYIAVSLMFVIAAMAGPRSESRFCILLPIVGGILTLLGWVHAPDQGQFIAFLVIMGILGVFSYMNDVNHEKHGVSGPGSKLMNIVFFIIIFQVAVGTISGFDLFSNIGQSQPIPNGCTVGYQCDAFGNIELSQSVTTVNESGGLFQDIVSMVASLPSLAINMLKFMVTILTSVTLFAIVLNSAVNGVFPGIASNAAYISVIALMQVGIWIIYASTIYTWYYKPMPGEGTI